MGKDAWKTTVNRANQGNEFFSIYDANAIVWASSRLSELEQENATLREAVEDIDKRVSKEMCELSLKKESNKFIEEVAWICEEVLRRRAGVKE